MDGTAIASVSPPDNVVVHARVNIDSCPNQNLLDKHVKSVEGMIFHSDHLRRNIKKVEFLSYSSRHGDNQKFDLTVGPKLWVDPSNLWENARAYTWKHLGQSEWKLGDGSILTFNRIHVKY